MSQEYTDKQEPRNYTDQEYKVLQKVGVMFTRDELKLLEDMLNDSTTNLSADPPSRGSGSAAYHR